MKLKRLVCLILTMAFVISMIPVGAMSIVGPSPRYIVDYEARNSGTRIRMTVSVAEAMNITAGAVVIKYPTDILAPYDVGTEEAYVPATGANSNVIRSVTGGVSSLIIGGNSVSNISTDSGIIHVAWASQKVTSPDKTGVFLIDFIIKGGKTFEDIESGVRLNGGNMRIMSAAEVTAAASTVTALQQSDFANYTPMWLLDTTDSDNKQRYTVGGENPTNDTLATYSPIGGIRFNYPGYNYLTSFDVTAVGDKTSIAVGEKLQLTAGNFMPENASNNNVRWVSSNSTIATVDGNGIVTAVSSEAYGSADVTIVAFARDGSEVSDSIDLTVTKAKAPTPATPVAETVGAYTISIKSASDANSWACMVGDTAPAEDDWKTSNNIEGLTPGETYKIYAKRVCDADDTKYTTSDISEPLTVTTAQHLWSDVTITIYDDANDNGVKDDDETAFINTEDHKPKFGDSYYVTVSSVSGDASKATDFSTKVKWTVNGKTVSETNGVTVGSGATEQDWLNYPLTLTVTDVNYKDNSTTIVFANKAKKDFPALTFARKNADGDYEDKDVEYVFVATDTVKVKVDGSTDELPAGTTVSWYAVDGSNKVLLAENSQTLDLSTVISKLEGKRLAAEIKNPNYFDDKLQGSTTVAKAASVNEITSIAIRPMNEETAVVTSINDIAAIPEGKYEYTVTPESTATAPDTNIKTLPTSGQIDGLAPITPCKVWVRAKADATHAASGWMVATVTLPVKLTIPVPANGTFSIKVNTPSGLAELEAWQKSSGGVYYLSTDASYEVTVTPNEGCYTQKAELKDKKGVADSGFSANDNVITITSDDLKSNSGGSLVITIAEKGAYPYDGTKTKGFYWNATPYSTSIETVDAEKKSGSGTYDGSPAMMTLSSTGVPFSTASQTTFFAAGAIEEANIPTAAAFAAALADMTGPAGWTLEAPVNAGTYTIACLIAPIDDTHAPYKATVITGTMDVAKAKLTLPDMNDEEVSVTTGLVLPSKLNDNDGAYLQVRADGLENADYMLFSGEMPSETIWKAHSGRPGEIYAGQLTFTEYYDTAADEMKPIEAGTTYKLGCRVAPTEVQSVNYDITYGSKDYTTVTPSNEKYIALYNAQGNKLSDSPQFTNDIGAIRIDSTSGVTLTFKDWRKSGDPQSILVSITDEGGELLPGYYDDSLKNKDGSNSIDVMIEAGGTQTYTVTPTNGTAVEKTCYGKIMAYGGSGASFDYMLKLSVVKKEVVTLTGLKTTVTIPYDGAEITLQELLDGAIEGTYGDQQKLTQAQIDALTVKWNGIALSGQPLADSEGKTMPVYAGTYNVTVSIPNTDPEYMGSMSAAVIISRAKLQVTGVDAVDREFEKADELTVSTAVGINTSGMQVTGWKGTDDTLLTVVFENGSVANGDPSVTAKEVFYDYKVAAKDGSPDTQKSMIIASYELDSTQKPSFDVVISPKVIEVTGVTAVDREYDGTRDITVNALTDAQLGALNAQLELGDRFTAMLFTGTVSSADVDTVTPAKSVTVIVDTATGEFNGSSINNYWISFDKNSTSVTISPKEVTATFSSTAATVSAEDATKYTATYTGNAIPFTVSYMNVSNTSVAATAMYKNGESSTATAPVLAGTYAVTASTGDSNYKVTNQVSLTVSKAVLTPDNLIIDVKEDIKNPINAALANLHTALPQGNVAPVISSVSYDTSALIGDMGDILSSVSFNDASKASISIQTKADTTIGDTGTAAITVKFADNTYDDLTFTLQMTVVQNGIPVLKNAPTTVTLGEDIDLSKMTMIVDRDDQDDLTLDSTGYSTTGYDKTATGTTAIGTKVITVQSTSADYGTYTKTFSINVVDKTVDINVTKPATEPTYQWKTDTALKLDGYTVTPIKQSEIIQTAVPLTKAMINVTDADIAKLGTYDVDVTYDGITKDNAFQIVVKGVYDDTTTPAVTLPDDLVTDPSVPVDDVKVVVKEPSDPGTTSAMANNKGLSGTNSEQFNISIGTGTGAATPLATTGNVTITFPFPNKTNKDSHKFTAYDKDGNELPTDVDANGIHVTLNGLPAGGTDVVLGWKSNYTGPSASELYWQQVVNTIKGSAAGTTLKVKTEPFVWIPAEVIAAIRNSGVNVIFQKDGEQDMLVNKNNAPVPEAGRFAYLFNDLKSRLTTGTIGKPPATDDRGDETLVDIDAVDTPNLDAAIIETEGDITVIRPPENAVAEVKPENVDDDGLYTDGSTNSLPEVDVIVPAATDGGRLWVFIAAGAALIVAAVVTFVAVRRKAFRG